MIPDICNEYYYVGTGGCKVLGLFIGYMLSWIIPYTVKIIKRLLSERDEDEM